MNQTGNKIESITAGTSHPNPNSPEAVLRDLARLLEEYGPAWYTEAQRRRVQAALQLDSGRRPSAGFGVSH
jgi:hypothetical protein